MRIAVMGAGGVGGYFGARLGEAGHDVAFIARGRHLAAMRERGLTVNSVLGDIRLPRPEVTADPASLAPADVVLLAVKLWDTSSAADAIRPLLAKGGVVIPFQNGVESIERIGAWSARTACWAELRISRPRSANRVSLHRGPWRVCALARCAAQQGAAEALHGVQGAASRPSSRPTSAARCGRSSRSYSGLTNARQPMGACAAIRICVRRSGGHKRAWAVGRAKGIALADDFVAQQMKFADGLPAEMKSSMLNDLVAGNRLEAPWLCGAVARMGSAAGVATPVNATLFAALKPYCAGAAR
jgi:2-dehydropantoate 2-reductase